jgi:hypothetical protein
MGAGAVGGVNEDAFNLRRLLSFVRKDVGPEFEYAVH